MKKLLIGFRTSIKLISLLAVSSIIILAIVLGVYKPIYAVTFNGEMLGYTDSKSEFQARISEFIETGNEDENDVYFVQIDGVPDYSLCFLKRDVETNEEEMYEKIISTGVTYYKYYAVAVDGEEKVYVETMDDANAIVNQLKEKDSKNSNKLSILDKYATEKQEFTAVEVAVENLYERKITEEIKNNMGRVTRAGNGGSSYKPVSISFQKPISATITSRFGSRWGTTHKGLDFGAPAGSAIHAAAEGTVTFSGWNSGGYGYLVIISHGDGVQTYYGHCSALDCKVGDYVYAGDTIARVGNTGDSQGNHLHFEIRVNDVAYNPEFYL